MVETAGATLTATFDSRRKADLAIEQLVQEHGLDRSDIFVSPEAMIIPQARSSTALMLRAAILGKRSTATRC